MISNDENAQSMFSTECSEGYDKTMYIILILIKLF